jgi:cell division protein FtsI (penicillin-binding protein 3)
MIVRKDYRPKLFVILVGFFFLYSVVAFRLFFIQIYQRDFFKVLAKQQYATEIKTRPPRALIKDRNGDPIVVNKEKLSAFILPRRLHEPKKTKKLLKEQFKEAYKRMRRLKSRRFLWLERRLSDERLKQIKSHKSLDIHFLEEPQRFYPFSSSSHVVGFTDVDNSGIAGIELQFNDRLGGVPTTFVLEKDARSGHFYFNRGIKKIGVLGDPVSLTIDKNLQFFAHEELKKAVSKHSAKGGAVLIIEPANGEIFAMVSSPGFDPNEMPIKDISRTKNIPVTECFELGSVIKVFTALAALQEAVVTPDEEIDCEGKATHIDGFRVENWKSLGPGKHPFWHVVARSNNVGIAKVAKRLGPQLYYHLRQLGFGSATGIRFPGERSGFVNPPYNWSRSSIIVLSFGYEIMATLLQLGKAFCVIANGGFDLRPVLVKDPKPKKSIMLQKRLYDKKIIDQIKSILELSGWLKDKYSIKGYRIMGKTGTARSVKRGKYSEKDHIYTYAGIIEKGSYRRVVITFIKQNNRKQ